MDAANSLVTRFIQDQLALFNDHTRMLNELGAHVLPAHAEFVTQWKLLLEQGAFAPGIAATNDAVEQAARYWLDALYPQTDIAAYLRGISEWAREFHTNGSDFLDGMRWLAAFRRALLPFVLQHYSAGAELELVFRALDVHERAVAGILATTEMEILQTQLAQGTHQRAVGRLTGGIAHALNNGLAIIVGRAQILEEQVTEESQREELRAIQKNARAGADSLRRLQQFAVERDTETPTRIDVNVLINDVVQLTRFRWRDDAEASGITIDVVKDLVPVPPVLGHASHLRDALVELILNSVEAMPLGGLVMIRTEQLEGQVQIAVTDQGEGMDDATYTRATEALFTTKGLGHIGLGLSVVRDALREMGGTFALKSERGRGTTALITLPIARETKDAADLRPARIARWANILVVDDEPMVRDVAARTFHLRGFRTVAADSGADAVRLFTEQGPFQVVIVDLGMPGMNGFDTARAIKDLNPRTIVILMTGWAAELDSKKMRDAGIDRAIAKPFDVDQVIQLISEALAIQEKM